MNETRYFSWANEWLSKYALTDEDPDDERAILDRLLKELGLVHKVTTDNAYLRYEALEVISSLQEMMGCASDWSYFSNTDIGVSYFYFESEDHALAFQLIR